MSGSTASWCQHFALDAYGNRVVDNVVGITRPPSQPTAFSASTNRVTAGGMTWNYDYNGNVMTDGAGSSFTYDAENRMLTGGGATYVYDGQGRRVSTTLNGTTTTFVYDAAGELAADYTTGTVASPCGLTCYLTADHLGSTRLVTNGSMLAVERVDYMPYGEEISFGAGTVQSGVVGYGGYVSGDARQRFTGKERDAETGLDYFGGKVNGPDDQGDQTGQTPTLSPGLRSWDFISRYFSSSQGRFTSPDFPLLDQNVEYPQSWNLFSYVRNNPLTFFDLNGGKCKKTKDGFEGDCASPGDEKVTEGDKAQQADVRDKQGSTLEYLTARPVPLYVPNDKPLPDNARKVMTVAYLQEHDLGCVGLGGAITGGGLAASSPIIPKAFSAGGTSATSPASRVLGGFNVGKSIPTPVGTPGTSTFAWRASANLGRIAGRYLPYVGTLVGAAAVVGCLGSN